METNIDSLIELNDSDILRLENVVRILNSRLGERLPLEAFRKEVIERFGEVGFRVDVKTWATNLDGVYSFDIEIQERLEGLFDPDQMVHETVSDILELGTGGVIKSEGGLHLPSKSTHVSRN